MSSPHLDPSQSSHPTAELHIGAGEEHVHASETDQHVHNVGVLSIQSTNAQKSVGALTGNLKIQSLNNPIPTGEAELTIGGPDIPEESIALHHGRDVIVNKNSYVDPITGNVFTLNYGSSIDEENWENCTRCLIGAVWEQIDAFVAQQAEHQEGFENNLKNVKSYTFDWKSGVIHLHMKGGTSYHIAVGKTLSDEIKPFLKNSVLADNLPEPQAMTSGLRGIQPPLDRKTESFLLYLALDPYSQKRIEEALEKLREDSKKSGKKNPDEDRYQVLLEALAAVKTGAEISFSEKARKNLEKALQPSFNFQEFVFAPKLDDKGDSWMRNAINNFQTHLNLYHPTTSATHTCDHHLDPTHAGPKAVDLAQSKNLKEALEHRPGAAHLQIDVHAPAISLEDNLAASSKRNYLHLEPRMNLGEPNKPRWAEVSQVTCLVSQEGTTQTNAEYLHFVKHGEKWWNVNGSECKEVYWSTVQQMASLHASRIGLDITPLPQATVTRERDADPAARAASGAFVPASVTVLDHGVAIAAHMKSTTWKDDHQEALTELRKAQAALFADDTTRSKVHAQLYFPALAPIIAAHPEYVGPKNTFTPAAQLHFKSFIESLATSDDHMHVPTKSLCHHEIQEMATAFGRAIVIVTGSDNNDRLCFKPENADDESTLEDLNPLFFSALSLDPKDSLARSTLIPLEIENQEDLAEEIDRLETQLDKLLQKPSSSPAPAPAKLPNPPTQPAIPATRAAS